MEHVAGAEHRAGFRQFIATGGLRGLLRRHALQPIEIMHSHFHTLAIAIIPKPKDVVSSMPMDVA